MIENLAPEPQGVAKSWVESHWWWCWGTSSVLMADLESYFSKAAVSGNLNITLSRNRLADTIILPQFSSPPTYFFSKTFLFGFWCGSFFRQKKRCTKNALENQNSELRSGFQLMWVVTWLPERLFVFSTAVKLAPEHFTFDRISRFKHNTLRV